MEALGGTFIEPYNPRISDMLLTVFTPTFNRAHLLSRTFQSLASQSFKDFEWLIVDDGSTDDTEAVVTSFQAKCDFPIHYIKKENGGKHTAHNHALIHAKGDFFFTVDSDDWLPEDGLTHVADACVGIAADKEVMGLIALKQFPDGRIIGNTYPWTGTLKTLRELELSGNGGERSLVFKTSMLRNYPYPVINGERFMTEAVVYDKFAVSKRFEVSNDTFTICEYQDNGLSSNPRHLMGRNPGCYKLYYRNRIDMAASFKERVGYLIRYNAFAKLYRGDQVEPYRGRHMLLKALLWPLTPFVARMYSKGNAK